ncbi:antitermination protein Q [Yersinia frederiksenii]|uniref:Antitermination protein Q n=1 Tax=Yersinia frederiksenii TaxID=29484 RepID=A0AAI8ZQ27_YERFR|nr:antitermination protein Q [Yersinia frederiksenii]CFR15038.1 antitermination protein Q [Yersinia frederiksenii]CNL46010.1 antitermination protein Q [Yersinia frederiksenii]CQH42702.1 antitermination protein Q [Yersinia frederiksenii]CQI99436.1 antitermination protein Q [Yersinia frederiksenii]
MPLSKEHHCSDGHIGKKLQNAEGVIDDHLMMLEVKLEMDKQVRLVA